MTLPDIIYIILTHSSRTNYKRHYNVLTVGPLGESIDDITPHLCKALSLPFDNVYGTLNSSGGYASQDASDLAQLIQFKLGQTVKVVKL